MRIIVSLALALTGCAGTTPPAPLSDEGATQDLSGSVDAAAPADAASEEDVAGPEKDVPEPPVVPRAQCDVPVGGDVPLLTETSVEAQLGYDELLAALDVQTLPETIDLAALSTIHRSVTAYMLEIDLDSLPDNMQRDEILAIEPMGRAVLLAFADGGPLGADLVTLRRGLHRFYQCARAFPLRLEDFKSTVLDYTDLVPFEVQSMPKNDIRRIREDAAAHVYVAETLIGDAVRETEILLADHRDDGALDFLVYDADGDLVDRSEFVTAVGTDISGAAPYACIACHFEPGTFRITVLFPDL